MLPSIGQEIRPAALWSPDSRRVLTSRVDERAVRAANLLHHSSTQAHQAVHHSAPLSTARCAWVGGRVPPCPGRCHPRPARALLPSTRMCACLSPARRIADRAFHRRHPRSNARRASLCRRRWSSACSCASRLPASPQSSPQSSTDHAACLRSGSHRRDDHAGDRVVDDLRRFK